MNNTNQQPRRKMSTWMTILAVLAVGIAIGAYFAGDRQMAAGSGLLFLLLIGCPLMMMFMMRGAFGGPKKDKEQKEEG